MGAFHSADQAAPAREWIAITPSDSALLPAGCRGLYIGGAGNIALAGYDGTVVTFTGVLAGSVLPCGPTKVMTTNTTATAIVGLY